MTVDLSFVCDPTSNAYRPRSGATHHPPWSGLHWKQYHHGSSFEALATLTRLESMPLFCSPT